MNALNSNQDVHQLLADIIYVICGKIGGSKQQQSHKQVGSIVTVAIFAVNKLKQELLSDLMNMQIRTFDVERSKTHDLGYFVRSAYTIAQRKFYIT